MGCDEYREMVLEIAATAVTRQRLLEALQHVQSCDQCQAVFTDFDQIDAHLKLDELAAVPDGGWAAFEQRLPRFSDRSDIAGRLKLWGRPSLGIATGIAAVLAIAVGAFWFGQQSISRMAVSTGVNTGLNQASIADPSSGFTPVSSGPQPYALNPKEVVQATTAFAEASKVFDRQAGWMLVSNSTETLDSRGMGISSQPVDLNRGVDVLRLTMLRCGKVVSVVDLVIVPGQSADLTVALPGGKSVRYLAGTLVNDETRLNLRAEIRSISGDPAIASLATTVAMKLGGQISAGELQTDSGRYELQSSFSRAVPMDR